MFTRRFTESSANPMLRDSTHRLNLLIFCLLFAINAALPTDSLAETYYLDAVSGNDTTGNGSSSAPWKTIAKAQSVAAEGDTVLLHSGNYGAFVDETTVRTSWVTYQADAGHTPIFSSMNLGRWNGPFDKYLHFKDITVQASAPEQSAIKALRANHLVFENIEIIGQGYRYPYWDGKSSDSKAIFVQDSMDIIIKDCHIYGVGDSYAVNWPDATSKSGLDPSLFGKAFVYGVSTLRVPNIEISGCVIESCDVGMHLNDARNSIIRGNNLSYFSSDAIELTGGVINQDRQWTIIENNHIGYLGHFTTAGGRALSGHNDAIQFFGTYGATWLNYKNMVVRGNIVHDSDIQGFFFRVGGDSENWIIENNLVYNIPRDDPSRVGAIRIFSTENITFRNNTVDGLVNVAPERDIVTFVSCSNNIVRRLSLNTEDNVIVEEENYNLINKHGYHMGNHVFGKDSVILNNEEEFKALFADYANNNYHLASGSLAIDFCPLSNAQNSPSPPIDMEGKVRVDIAGVGNSGTDYADAGCYEYIADPNNHAPVLEAIGNKSVSENSLLTIDVNATDPDGDPTTYLVQNLPAGAEFVSFSHFIFVNLLTPFYDDKVLSRKVATRGPERRLISR